MMELNRCTTGRALVVIANTTIPTPGYESLPRVSASTQISPQALLLPKYILGVDPKQRHSPHSPLWLLYPHLSSACLGAADVGASGEWDGCGPYGMTGEITTNTQVESSWKRATVHSVAERGEEGWRCLFWFHA